MSNYDQAFYEKRHAKTAHAAKTILSRVLDVIPPVRSAVDVGCGVGTWLSVLREKGVAEVKGFDGPWVDRELLQIPRESFFEADLSAPLEVQQHFDLAICLEVAEHLPPEQAKPFVKSLTDLSDFVLFSAAIPGQDGVDHINEQWQSYWAGLFDERGFGTVDCIREEIWDAKRIALWYRQNTLLFVRKERIADLRSQVATTPATDVSSVHPDLYLARLRGQQSISGAWKLFRRAVRAFFSKKLSLGLAFAAFVAPDDGTVDTADDVEGTRFYRSASLTSA